MKPNGSIVLLLWALCLLRFSAALTSCDNFKSAQTPWTVGCNTNTDDGYYWIIGPKIGEYGFYGFRPSGVSPPCNAATVGNGGNTYAWRNDADSYGMSIVQTDWCRGYSANPADGYLPCPGQEGPTFSCSVPHCGEYSATCAAQPGTVVSITPTVRPTLSATPTVTPTLIPTAVPSVTPSVLPTVTPSVVPSVVPSVTPTIKPSVIPTTVPTVKPTTLCPIRNPSLIPTRGPSFNPSATTTLVPSAAPVISCESFKSAQTPWTVGCNSNTDDGYYWIIGPKISEYGYYGFRPSGVSPHCNAATVGNAAKTVGWQYTSDSDGMSIVQTDYCRGYSDNPADATLPCPGLEGSTFPCSAPHCGEYSATCAAQPGTAVVVIPTMIPTSTPTYLGGFIAYPNMHIDPVCYTSEYISWSTESSALHCLTQCQNDVRCNYAVWRPSDLYCHKCELTRSYAVITTSAANGVPMTSYCKNCHLPSPTSSPVSTNTQSTTSTIDSTVILVLVIVGLGFLVLLLLGCCVYRQYCRTPNTNVTAEVSVEITPKVIQSGVIQIDSRYVTVETKPIEEERYYAGDYVEEGQVKMDSNVKFDTCGGVISEYGTGTVAVYGNNDTMGCRV